MTSLSGCSIRATRWGKVTVMGANAQTTVQKFLSGAVLTAEQQNFSAATGVPVFATTVTRDAAFGGANKVLAEGQLCYLESTDATQYYSGSAWLAVGASPTTAIFNETQASGTQGGTFTSGSFVKRTLNTTVANGITGCSISASVITLPAGTFTVTIVAPAQEVDRNQMRLQNTTAGTTILSGQPAFASAVAGVTSVSIAISQFVLASSSTVEVQHRCAATRYNYGLGHDANFGISEVYTQITITKVA